MGICAVWISEPQKIKEQTWTIKRGTFDTRMPLNINDEDLDLESKSMPAERSGVTDTSHVRIFAQSWDIMTQLMAPGGADIAADLEVKRPPPRRALSAIRTELLPTHNGEK